ncbi:hypothetical protein DYH09_19475 [bacterium CPR1]|nr:hypothetical protein [bacterium CPR1]
MLSPLRALVQAGIAVTAPRPATAQLPKDEVVLGGTPATATESWGAPGARPTPGPVPVPIALMTEEPSVAAEDAFDRFQAEQMKVLGRQGKRQSILPEVARLAQQLADKKLEGKAFGQAGLRLEELAESCPGDPVAQRLIRNVMVRNFRYEDNCRDLVFKLGPEQAVQRGMEAMEGWSHGQSNWLTKDVVEPWLGLLDEVTRQSRPSVELMRTTASVAHSFFERADTRLDPKIREHESAEQNRAWGQSFAMMLAAWADEGSLQVTRGGKPVAPADIDWAALLKSERPPISEQGELRLEAPVSTPKPSKKVREKVQELGRALDNRGWGDKYDDPVVGMFDALVKENPSLARQVADEMANQAIHYRANRTSSYSGSDFGSMLSLGLILQRGQPESVELFRPHAAAMAGLTSRLAETRDLSWNSTASREHRSELYRGLLKSFPELNSARFLSRELLPLTLASTNAERPVSQLLLEQFDAHPDWMTPVMDDFMTAQQRDTFRSPGKLWPFLTGAAERGWKPSPTQLDWIAGFLCPSAKTEDESIKRNSERFIGAAETLGLVEKHHPGLTRGLLLPDNAGKLVPWKRAAIDALLHEPEADVRDFFAPPKNQHSLTIRGLDKAYAAILPDRAVQDDLLERVTSAYAQSPDFKSWARPDQMAITILGSSALTEDQHEKMRAIARPEFERDQGWYVFNDIVDVYRREYQDELKEKIVDPKTSVSDLVQAGLDSVRTFSHRVLDSDLHIQSRAYQEPLRQALQSRGALETEVDRLVDTFIQEAAGQSDLSQVPLSAQRGLWLAYTLATGEQDLTERFVTQIRPALRAPCEYDARPVYYLKGHLDEVSRGMATERMPIQPDHQSCDRLLKFSLSAPDAEPDVSVVHAWSERVSELGGWASRMPGLYPDKPHSAYRLYRAVADSGRSDQAIEDDWPALQGLFDKLDGNNDNLAVSKATRDFLAMRADGSDRQTALDAVYRRYITGQQGELNPGSSVMGETPQAVQLGAIRLRKRVS